MKNTKEFARQQQVRLSPHYAIVALFAWCCACGGGGDADSNKAPPAPNESSTVGETPGRAGAASDNPRMAAQSSTQAAVDGAVIFARCSTCHQSNGQGLIGVFPPLAGSEIVVGKPSAAVAVVLRGLQGPLTVGGHQFNSIMPPFGTGSPLSDAEVAAVLTYVRGSWENQASPVTVEMVAATRAAMTGHAGLLVMDDITGLLR